MARAVTVGHAWSGSDGLIDDRATGMELGVALLGAVLVAQSFQRHIPVERVAPDGSSEVRGPPFGEIASERISVNVCRRPGRP